MRMLATSLATWDTIETGQRHKHGITFPLAILDATLQDAGFPPVDVWEGDEQPTARDHEAILISAMDSRHFWRIPPFLRQYGIPVRAVNRPEGCPIVVMGGQAATAPAPVEPFVDVVYIGYAEAHAAELMRTIADGRRAEWTRSRILEACAAVPGCLVPSHHSDGHRVRLVEADDISVTLRERLNVNHRQIHRVELARGCQSMCGFCALAWRAKYRENDADDIIESLARTKAAGINEVHLSAGDAESYSEIERVRAAVAAMGLRDHGWTGRLDTIRDCSVSAGKQFAVGIEGMSHRLRSAVGKHRLTNEYILREVEAYWQAGGRRLMFHMIGRLPGETDDDAEEFAALMRDLEALVPSGQRYGLEIGRQPFGPLPHTPMQWFAPGLVTDRIARVVARYTKSSRLKVEDKAGQQLPEALVNAVVMRGGPEVAALVEGGPPRLGMRADLADPRAQTLIRSQWATWLRRGGVDPDRYLGAWDPDAPTPWNHVATAYDDRSIRRAYDRIARMLLPAS